MSLLFSDYYDKYKNIYFYCILMIFNDLGFIDVLILYSLIKIHNRLLLDDTTLYIST